MRRPLWVLVLLVALITAPVGLAAGVGRDVTIGRGSGVGEFAGASAFGVAMNPVRITIEVTATPAQRVLVTYSNTCQGARGGSTSANGQFHATTPVLHHALLFGHPEQCFIMAQADLVGSGVVHLRLIGYERH
jgi:hypothetical protein